jgi:hypothetical protein
MAVLIIGGLIGATGSAGENSSGSAVLEQPRSG